MFTLGTGVGGGIIIGDLLVEGENSPGAELGHMIIDYHDDARMCSCGQRGHLEAYASAIGGGQAHRRSAWRRAGELACGTDRRGEELIAL